MTKNNLYLPAHFGHETIVFYMYSFMYLYRRPQSSGRKLVQINYFWYEYEYEKLYFSRVNLSALQVMLLSTGALYIPTS